jgi:hypothetical protein
MKYQIEVEVEADAFCERLFEVRINEYHVEPLVDDNRKLRALLLSTVVQDYTSYLPTVGRDPSTDMLTFSLRDGELAYRLIDMAQHIESIGSFWLGISKVYWESPTRRWVGDTPEELDLLKALPNEWKETRSEKDLKLKVTPEILGSIIANRSLHANLTLPMSFYREGCNDFKRGCYANAFVNFYFYLDDLYGAGATKNKQVEERFKQSVHVQAAVKKAIEELARPGPSENLSQVMFFLQEERKQFTVDGVIELIVQVRGNLAHFSQKSTKRKGHAFNQYDFRGVAYLLQAVCIFTFSRLTTGEPPR